MTSRHIPGEYEVETFSGQFVDVNSPDPTTISLTDIAHALGNICRYGGHCKRFYSVAQHSVFVSKRVERKGGSRLLQLGALHHDDAEAFLGDIPRPLKPLLGAAYKRLTDRMDAAIVEALELPLSPEIFHDPVVKMADNWSLFVEARNLLPSEGRSWWDGGQGSAAWGLEPLPTRIVIPDYFYDFHVDPRAATAMFVERHELLTREG